MVTALVRTFKAVLLSALTTIAGFLALTFGHLTLIKEMGWLLLQGVTLSFLFTLVFLPAFLLTFNRTTRLHKFDLQAWLTRASVTVGRTVSRAPVVIVLIFCLLVPAAWFMHRRVVQTFNRQDYMPPTASFSIAQTEYEQYFGNQDTLYIVLDRLTDHSDLLRQVQKLPSVKQVLSPTTMIDASIPQELLPKDVVRRFTGSKYTLAIVTSMYGIDDARNDQLKTDIAKLIKDLPGEHYLTGTSVITDDLKKAGQADLGQTTWITIALIGLLLLIGFRSLSLPALLVLVIETAIWINLSWYALVGATVTFLVPIVLNTIQLGSTIDYSVLAATRFEEEAAAGKVDNMANTVRTSLPSIVVSAGTFVLMALPTAILSNVPVIKQIMSSLVRGAAVSAVMVIVFVPALLQVLRRPIAWTSLGFKTRKEQKK
jgi:predicted RND superfamily exporter protein